LLAILWKSRPLQIIISTRLDLLGSSWLRMVFIVRECKLWLGMAVILLEPTRELKSLLSACEDACLSCIVPREYTRTNMYFESLAFGRERMSCWPTQLARNTVFLEIYGYMRKYAQKTR